MIVVRDQPYPSIEALARAFKLKPTTIRDYRNRHNLTWEEVIDHYTGKKRTVRFSYKGKNFSSMKEAYKYYGFTESQINSFAYNEELSTEEALIGYIEKRFPLNMQFIDVGYVSYPSIFKCLKAFKVPYAKWKHESEKEFNREVPFQDLLSEIMLSSYFKSRNKAVLSCFEEHDFSTDDIISFSIKSGIPLDKLWIYYQKHHKLPYTINRGRFYIQFHYFSSIPLACCYFNLDVQKIRTIKDTYKTTWNGAFTLMLQSLKN